MNFQILYIVVFYVLAFKGFSNGWVVEGQFLAKLKECLSKYIHILIAFQCRRNIFVGTSCLPKQFLGENSRK